MMKRKVIFLQPHHELYFLRVKDGLPHVLYILPDKIELNNSSWNMKNFCKYILRYWYLLTKVWCNKKIGHSFLVAAYAAKFFLSIFCQTQKSWTRNFEPSHFFSLSLLYKLAEHDGPKLRYDWRHRWFGIRVHFFHTRPNS